MLVQFILAAVILLIIFSLIVKLKRREIRAGQLWGWLILWLAAMAVVWQPQLTSRLADIVGIGRGADLVVYSALIVVFYLMFRLLMRLEKMEKNITELVRQAALNDQEDRGNK